MATLHRFRDSVALSLSGPGSTRYMSAATARDMAAALIKAADSIAQERFTDSGCLDWSGPDHADATAAAWRAEGGLRNPRLFRVQGSGGRWRYYRAED